MKKIIAVLLAVVLVCSLSASAWAAAQKTDVKETRDFNWETFSDLVEEKDGDFYTFDEVALKIWIPKELESIALTEEDVESGYIGYFEDEDETYVVSVVLADAGVKSLDEWKTVLKDEYDIKDAESCTINGYDAVMYSDEEEDYFCVDCMTETDKILEFTFSPYSDEDFFLVSCVILSSIQPYEE